MLIFHKKEGGSGKTIFTIFYDGLPGMEGGGGGQRSARKRCHARRPAPLKSAKSA